MAENKKQRRENRKKKEEAELKRKIKTAQKMDTEKRHDVVFLARKDVYLNRYKEPFTAKHIDTIMGLFEKVLMSRDDFKIKDFYCAFIKNGEQKDDAEYRKLIESKRYYPYIAAISINEKEIYEFFNIDKEILAPSAVDILRSLWWSLVNGKELLTDKDGWVVNREDLDDDGNLKVQKEAEEAYQKAVEKQEEKEKREQVNIQAAIRKAQAVREAQELLKNKENGETN